VAGADAIVVSRPPDDEQWRHLLDAHTRLGPGIPLCVEFLPDSAEAPTQLRVPEGDPADAAMYVEKVARAHRSGLMSETEHEGRDNP
jgi:hypothetical protein